MGFDYRRGFCGCCVRTAKSLPVIFILAVVCWSYYAYLVQLCLFTVLDEEGVVVTILLVVLYHFCLVMFLWSYYQIVMTPPGKVPRSFKLTSEELDSIESSRDPKATLEQLVISKDIPVVMRSIQGEVRYCSECCQIKPDRCHHCSVCGECVLKMDHHCPWVNNCVAFQNYKYFILFLGYALTYCLYVAFSTLKYFLQFWSGDITKHYGKFHILFLFFVSAMFALSVTSLFSYHLYLVSRNRTTLEAFRTPIFRGGSGPDKMAFHLGIYNNFQEVFGDKLLLWFIPISTSLGDGIVYPQRGHLSESDEESGLLSGYGNSYRDETSNEELVPMIRAAGTGSDDDEDEEDDGEWSKIDVKDFGSKESNSKASSGNCLKNNKTESTTLDL